MKPIHGVILGAVALAACDRGDVNVVAEAAGHELTVDRLADLTAQGKAVLLEPDVIARVAGLWIDYTLLAQRLADGDSLLDSATVVEAMWGQARQAVVDHYHEELLENRVAMSGVAVDSAYAAGDHRIIHHILFRAPSDMAPPERTAQKQKADRLREQVARGRIEWERANELNEDYAAKSAGGNLGLLGRGATVPPFESVAFALAPGEVSAVTQTSYGYHIIRRPLLDEVRDQFQSELETLFIEQMDSTFLRELEVRWEVKVREDAPDRMREAAEDLSAAKRSDKVIGTYRGGRFTVADFTRWLQTLDVRYQGEVTRAEDAPLSQFALALMRNHLLVMEAEEAGHALDGDDFKELRDGLVTSLVSLREHMGLDSALAGAAPASPDAFRVVEATVLDYLAAVMGNRKNLIPVPPFLADELRAEASWEVSPAGVRRVVERAVARRAEIDSAAAVSPPVEEVKP